MLRIKCEKHPRFTGTSSPRASCEQCIALRELRFSALGARLHVEPSESSKED